MHSFKGGRPAALPGRDVNVDTAMEKSVLSDLAGPLVSCRSDPTHAHRRCPRQVVLARFRTESPTML